MSIYRGVNIHSAFNQEKALVGAFSVIVKTECETDGALHSTSAHLHPAYTHRFEKFSQQCNATTTSMKHAARWPLGSVLDTSNVEQKHSINNVNNLDNCIIICFLCK